MSRPHIENSDRGITLNKSLAWTVAVVIMTGGVTIMSTLTGIKTNLETLAERQVEDRMDIRSNTAAITSLQAQYGVISNRLSSIEQYSRESRDSIRELRRLLTSTPPD